MRALVPWPLERSIETPGRRCSDSATFWSGNLPISSADTDSMIWFDSRLFCSASASEARKPVTITSSSGSLLVLAVEDEGCAAYAPIVRHEEIAALNSADRRTL